ncbi:MAG: methylenetetrahydrofolate reductase [Francisellaceae bacterium]
MQDQITQQWMNRASIETIPHVIARITDLHSYIHPGQYVYVTYLPNAKWQEVVSACQKLSRLEALPVAHVPARHFKDEKQLKGYVEALSRVGVRHVLLLAGDRSEPVGCFDSALALLDTSFFNAPAFDSIGFAVHPEGHPHIDDSRLKSAMERKISWAKQQSCRCYFITQFVFDASSIARWYKTLTSMIQLPVYIGLPGLTKPKTLLNFATMAGISYRRIAGLFLRHPVKWLKFSRRWSPEYVIDDMANFVTRSNITLIQGIHFYTFGGFKATAKWLKERHPDDVNSTTIETIKEKDYG